MNTKHTDITRRKALALSAGYSALLVSGSASAQSTIATYKAPDVYVQDMPSTLNSVRSVETAIPAFIGYTQKAVSGDKSLTNKFLTNKPTPINSLSEFHDFFGGAPTPKFDLVKVKDNNTGGNETLPRMQVSVTVNGADETYDLVQANQSYALYASIRHFYLNGGERCFIVSVGSYGDSMNFDHFSLGLKTLEKENETTLLVIPESVRLPQLYTEEIQRMMLAHCGVQKNRFAILDVFAGHRLADSKSDPIHDFRKNIISDSLSYGAAYYPWLKTTVFSANEFTYANLTDNARTLLVNMGLSTADKTDTSLINTIKQMTPSVTVGLTSAQNTDMAAITAIDKTLRARVPVYAKTMKAITDFVNCMPPSAAMAGVYTRVDKAREVWQAPANVVLKSVAGPSVTISSDLQKSLNITPSGKAINAIKSFPGRGTIVWGAGTLDANSPDWRYISARRTIIMLENSISRALTAFVFAQNDANTWTSVNTMISAYLTGIWSTGGLAGATATQAFEVNVGLGNTMTPEDILNGIMKVDVKVALIRPAEFTVITIQQKMG